MKFLQDLENKIENAELNAARKKLNMSPLTEEEKEVLNKEREDKAKKEKEERKIKDIQFEKKVNGFADKCGSFGWGVIKTQLSLMYLAAFGFIIYFLFVL